MAIIYTYPSGAVKADDLILVSEQDSVGVPTKNITVSDLANFVTSTGEGTGTTDYIVKWVDGPNGLIGDSPMYTFDGGAGLKQAILSDGYRFVVDRDATTTVGDPEYAITQNGVNKTSFGWDDDGGGFGFLYNWAGKGFKFGSTTLYPQFEILTDPDIKNISFADLELAPTGAGPSVGSVNLVFRGVDDLSNELDAAKIFTLDSTINPSGQDLYIQNANDVGTLTTNIFVDAFGFVGIGKTNPGANLDIANDLIVGTGVTFSDYGSGTRTGTATYSLAVDANGVVIEEPLGGIPWDYNYSAPLTNLMQGTSQAPTGADNTSLGMFALNQVTTGQRNVAIGRGAGNSIQDGTSNICIGHAAGESITSGDHNIAIGDRALANETAHGDNIAIGNNTLTNQQVGSNAFNIAIGSGAGSQITTGRLNTLIGGVSTGDALDTASANVAIGLEALSSETSGSYNTAVGTQALRLQNSGGSQYNVAVGYQAGNAVSTGINNTIIGGLAALNVVLTGDNNIIIGYNTTPSSASVTNEITIGNTNNTTLRLPGLQTTASDGDILTYSAATGDIQLQAPGGGGATDLNGLSDCLIDGTSSYLVNVPAGLSGNPVDNTVLGNGAGNALTTGANNTLIGSLVGDSITTGTKNVAIGDEALSSAGIAVGGTVAIGYQAGLSTASSNGVCIGYQSGKSNSGNGFIAVGYRSGYSNTSGSWNTTLGYFAAYTNTTGSENTTIGTEAGYNNTGTGNTFLGYQAGYTQTTGSNNTVIGHDAEPSAITVSDEITLGDANIATLRCAVNTITLISDERDKTDIQDIDYGLDLIEKLKPRKFTWNSRDGKKQGQKEVGFIAQELQQVDDEYLNFVLDNNPDKLEAGWMQLVPVLVKAIQELKEEIEELKRNKNV